MFSTSAAVHQLGFWVTFWVKCLVHQLGFWVDYGYSFVTQRDRNLAEFLIGRKMKY